MTRVAIALPLALACAWAFAQGQPQPPQDQASAAAGGSPLVVYDEAEAKRLFRELDRDGDGYLSAEERGAQGAGEGNWIAVDRDGDGRIGPAEFTAIKRR